MKLHKSIYLCGPTVYDSPHIGNMRPIISFDIFIRALRFLGTEITLIHNITDIDDKIITKALQENVDEKTIADRYMKEYQELLKVTNVEKPTHMPSVLQEMDNIILFIKKLIEKDFAYESNGNVYFAVSKIPNYGSVSGQQIKEMQYEGGENKKHPADFALWKKTSAGVKFKSPWGDGRPGWHTECAVFIDDLNNHKSLDIHGGGIDLIFPHHENENAQYIALNNCEIAKEWIHLGHVNWSGQKMSKSIGNIISANEFIQSYGVDTLRQIFITSSPFSPIDMSPENIDAAREMTQKLKKSFIKTQLISEDINFDNSKVTSFASELAKWNFASALKIMYETNKNFNKTSTKEDANNLRKMLEIIGYSFTKQIISRNEKALYNKWESLRENKQFKEADEVRQELIRLEII